MTARYRLDSAAARRHKGLAKLPPTALRIEGPGSDANQNARAFVYGASRAFSIAEADKTAPGAQARTPPEVQSQK